VGISTWGVSKWGISKWGINRTGSEAGRDSSLKSSFGMLKISPRQSELEQAEADADADQAKTQDTKTQNTKIQNTNDASSPAAKPAITAVKKQPRLALPVAFASTEDTPSFERHSLFGTERQGDYANPFTHKLPSSLSIQKEAPADKKTKKTHKQQMGKDSEKDLEKHLSHSDRLNSKQNAKSKSRSMNDY
jgi:hypothetical protein